MAARKAATTSMPLLAQDSDSEEEEIAIGATAAPPPNDCGVSSIDAVAFSLKLFSG